MLTPRRPNKESRPGALFHRQLEPELNLSSGQDRVGSDQNIRPRNSNTIPIIIALARTPETPEENKRKGPTPFGHYCILDFILIFFWGRRGSSSSFIIEITVSLFSILKSFGPAVHKLKLM